MSSSKELINVVERLEAVAAKLEQQSKNLTPIPSGTSSNQQASLGSNASGALYLSILSEPLAAFLKLSEKIGGLVVDQSKLIKKIVDTQTQIIDMASVSKKPESAQMHSLMTPLSKLIEAVVECKDKNRASPLINHLTTVADGVSAFGWVVVDATPAPYINEMKDSAQFYGNRVIKQYKEKEPVHIEWVNSYSQLLQTLFDYVKNEHTTGLHWNPKGGNAQPLSTTSSSSPSAMPPPPPPPPATLTSTTSTAKAGTDLSQVFNQLNIGDKVTSGLRKVDPSEMTHKNPSLRTSSVVTSKSPAKSASPMVTSSTVSKGEPKLYCDSNRWVVENYTRKHDIEINEADLKQAVYIHGCEDCLVKVNGKVKSVLLDACKKTAVIVDTLITSFDIVNCKQVQIQVNGSVPTILIDKTDGAKLFLSKEAFGTEIYTAKSTEVNVVLPSEKEDQDSVEKYVSEQIKTTICPKTLNLISVPVEHAG